MDKITQINLVLKDYFMLNKNVKIIPAKDMMSYFVLAGVFPSDQKNGLPIRKILRTLDEKNQLPLIPFVYPERKLKNTSWFFRNSSYSIPVPSTVKARTKLNTINTSKNSRKNSDEHYVIDLCDKVINKTGLRQHRFNFLLGDANANGVCSKLPVDVYYPELNLVIEYKEQQHSKANKHFDKPDVMTVSGVHRGEQRRIYDQRRLEVLPKHGIQVIEISYLDFEFDGKDKILRNEFRDLERVRKFLKGKI
ncbi:hypothetical protein SAMN04488062_102260 [Flavobacterium omnivorum]|uniref:Uncharacterized protein n=1 Tax=Flavobacterium omnivorum TaxID=178355 RepID=A0A1G7XEP5_9FLAO|nr:hypothetical protein [Flavobacterium omnivorum]SDG82010.1 hypothetical protein SAMN04488062_102260 [Flavobacterium omnivorum]